MKVIPFPPAALTKRKGLQIEVLDEPTEHLAIGTFSVTCPTCLHCNGFDTKTTIFKSLEFFCGGCGKAIKVTNPALRTKMVTRDFKER